MCIICGMRNDCFCWLLLIGVGVIRSKLPQVTELQFVCVLLQVTAPHLSGCFMYSTIWTKDFQDSFVWFLIHVQKSFDA